jgi:hypothetical protein
MGVVAVISHGGGMTFGKDGANTKTVAESLEK